MKSNNGFAPTQPSHANLPPVLAALKAPNGRMFGDLSGSAIVRIGLRARIANVSEENGRQENIEIIAKHLDQLRTAAADAAIENWLRENV